MTSEPGDYGQMSEHDPDRPEQFSTDFMDCPECNGLAEITRMELLEPADGMGSIFMWRTYCIQAQHHRDNYWYHIPAAVEDDQ